MIGLLALAAAAPVVEETPMSTAPRAEVAVRRESHAVVFTWSVQSEESVWLCDELLAYAQKGPEVVVDRAVVRQPPADGAPLRVTVGYTPPYAMPMRELYPVVREVPAGTRATGTVRVTLPLASFHPAEPHGTKLDEPAQVVVAIAWLPEAPATADVTLGDGTVAKTLTAASARKLRWLEVPVAWPVSP